MKMNIKSAHAKKLLRGLCFVQLTQIYFYFSSNSLFILFLFILLVRKVGDDLQKVTNTS